MTDRTYIDPKTAEVKDATPRPFDEFIRELAEGATNSELSDGLWDLLQRVQDTGRGLGEPSGCDELGILA